ncbi:MAG: SUMF1/EgtB/PvdO family nonheme iron enzyme, partial [bacterium]|nr:SUMF1/EgtB/PvdO family nonheme iron enzyme [bacterium]
SPERADPGAAASSSAPPAEPKPQPTPTRVAQLPPQEPAPRERTTPLPEPEPQAPAGAAEPPVEPASPEASEPPAAELPAQDPEPAPQEPSAEQEASEPPLELAVQEPPSASEPPVEAEPSAELEAPPASQGPSAELESRMEPAIRFPRRGTNGGFPRRGTNDGLPQQDPLPPAPAAPELASLRIRSNVSSNVVYVDGRRVGSTPLDKQVRPGSYRVEGRKARCVSDSTLVSVTAGNIYDVFLNIGCDEPETAAVESPGRPSASSSGKWMAFSGAGTLWREKTSGLNMSFHFAPAGRFLMGSPLNEKGRARDEVRREVLLTRGFWIGETEVTQGQWKALMGRDNNPSGFAGCGDWCPVEMVNWFDALAFANAMSLRSGFEPCYRLNCKGQPGINLACTDVVFFGSSCKGYRLPTEAEWEYAARAGTIGPYSGASLDAVAWHYGNSGIRTHRVGRKAANPWGLRDMLGNVWEWVWDRYAGGYPRGLATDPVEPYRPTDLARVFRGGSFGFTSGGGEGDEMDYCRSASRYQGPAGDRANYVGFRLVRTHRE